MVSDRNTDADALLDGLFAEARDTQSLPDGLSQRLLADAAAAVPVPDAPMVGRGPVLGAGFWATLLDGLGGWPSLAGIGTAAIAGLWIGGAQPSLVDGIIGLDTSVEAVSDDTLDTYFPSYFNALDEG